MIDTHAHIYEEKFNADIDAVIASAKEVGVDHILMPNIDSQNPTTQPHGRYATNLIHDQ